MDQGQKKPLYRRVNTRTHRVIHDHGRDYRRDRADDKRGVAHVTMQRGVHRGLDYTPLFRFLLSRVGQEWAPTHSEAVSRLPRRDSREPIAWLVGERRDLARELVCLDESSYWTGLYVDDDGVLRVVNPEITEETLKPRCPCCTHTLNGVRVTQSYDG